MPPRLLVGNLRRCGGTDHGAGVSSPTADRRHAKGVSVRLGRVGLECPIERFPLPGRRRFRVEVGGSIGRLAVALTSAFCYETPRSTLLRFRSTRSVAPAIDRG